MSLSRRQFIQASGIMLCAASLPSPAHAASDENPLPVPPLIESRRGQPLFLTLQHCHWSFSGSSDDKTQVLGVNGRYMGPTVRVSRGDDVKLIWSNCLAEPVAMSVSGLQVSGALMGGAPRVMPAGAEWAPVIAIRQAAATCWYHATTPGCMAQQVYQGLAGIWLIEDEVSRALPLPDNYGVDDFPLIIQDKRLTNDGIPEYSPPAEGGFVGNTILVNGVCNPFIEVPRGWVRLRLLNAANARRFELRMSDGRLFNVIASDQGFLPVPVAVHQLSLAPGERREILVDVSQGEEVSITAGETATLLDRLRGFFQPDSALLNANVLTLRPVGLLSLAEENLPVRLLADQVINGAPGPTREFHLGDNTPGINGMLWNIHRIDVRARQGGVERWIIRSALPQSFHIQGVMFLIKSVNGAPAVAEDRGWKDTVWVDGEVELLVSFGNSSSEYFPFVYYSQTLELADRGSAGQLLVTPVAETGY